MSQFDEDFDDWLMPDDEYGDDEQDVEFPDTFVVAVTAKALLCRIDGEEIWFPRSQITDDSELWEEKHKGQKGKLVVTFWIANQKGLV